MKRNTFTPLATQIKEHVVAHTHVNECTNVNRHKDAQEFLNTHTHTATHTHTHRVTHIHIHTQSK